MRWQWQTEVRSADLHILPSEIIFQEQTLVFVIMLLRQSLNSSAVNVIRKTVAQSSTIRNYHYRLSINSLGRTNNKNLFHRTASGVSCEKTFGE
jgi:hypothetical protein